MSGQFFLFFHLIQLNTSFFLKIGLFKQCYRSPYESKVFPQLENLFAGKDDLTYLGSEKNSAHVFPQRFPFFFQLSSDSSVLLRPRKYRRDQFQEEPRLLPILVSLFQFVHRLEHSIEFDVLNY